MAARWYERAQRLTSELLEEDQWRLHMLGEALPARLAEAWWKLDQSRAKRWLEESVQAITFGYQNDKDEVRDDRLDAAAVVFEVASRYDRAAAEKIATMLMDIAQQGDNRDKALARSTIRHTLNTSFRSADGQDGGLSPEDIGEMLVQMGDSNLHPTLGQIARKDPAAAQRLYSEALTKASASGNYNMLFGLAQYAWPSFESSSSEAIPDSSRAQLLDAVAAVMVRPPQSSDDQQKVCRMVARIAERLLDKFPASQAGMVQGAVNNCDAQYPDDDVTLDCSSVETCLEAADLKTKASDRAQLKLDAAFHASSDQQHIRALDILDSFSPEEREASDDWAIQRSQFVIQAVEQLYKQHDTVRIQRILDDTPEGERAEVLLNFSLIVSMQGRDKPYGQLLLSQARGVLEKNPSPNPHTYTQLLSAYAMYIPEDALQVFTLAVSGLNQIKYDDRKNTKKDTKDPAKDQKKISFSWAPLGSRLEPTTTPVSLLENDDVFVFASIKGLDDPRARASFRLGYLQSSLKKYQELKNAKPKPPGVRVAVESKTTKN
jgi:hypothetical protein